MKITKALTLAVCAAFALLGSPALSPAAKDIRWGTAQVGSAGHKALTVLVEVLKKNMPEYQFTVQPTTGAILTVKGYATGQYDGYYGADIAFYELANDINRFKGFKAQIKRMPVQSFWTYTVEVGAGIHKRELGKLNSWSDLNGRRVFTGPRPWDVRAHLERAFTALGVKHQYLDVAINTAGSLMEGGRFDAMIIYTNALSTTAPWITQASMETEWAALNPSADEVQKLKQAGFQVVEVDRAVFGKTGTTVSKVVLLPFYYGFHVGLEVPADDVYRMLKIIEANAADLVRSDGSYQQIVSDMPGMQRRGVESSLDLVPVHPGLAKYMREKGVWDSKWDSRVAR
ncbi:MAG: TRAP transporter substrate-binding protein [Candidatus Lambdaproteobacteria bacterium]|nr:TRAP transporter substrate-binding protein [Candidatus Lambdaproteobacteria bacterium]